MERALLSCFRMMDRHKRGREEGGEHSEWKTELRVQGHRCASKADDAAEIRTVRAFPKEALPSLFASLSLLKQSINEHYRRRGRG